MPLPFGHSKAVGFAALGSITVSQERDFWVAWAEIHGMGAILQKRLAVHFGSLAAAWNASPDRLLEVEGIGLKLAWAIAEQRPRITPQVPSVDVGAVITPADAEYPPLLYELPDPPPVLYCQGHLELLTACQSHPGVGIVGTRSPSEYGKRWTRRLTKALSRAGFLIISGLADGIDREAHQSCLEVNGQTIAVLGTGVDVVYPYRNRALYQEIAQAGLLVSEHPPGTQPDRTHFPRRNRIIAGLSRVLLVTEAPRKSGALITAQLANDYGRDVFVLPGSLDNPRCYGCLELVNQGAQMVLEEQTLIDALGIVPLESSPEPTPPPLPDLEPHLMQVFQAVPGEARSLDSIVQQVDTLTTGDILSALVQLELMGLVSQLPGMQYQRCTG